MINREKIFTGVVLILGLFNFILMGQQIYDMPAYGNLEYYKLDVAVFALYGIVLVATSLVNLIRRKFNLLAVAIQIIIFIFLPPSFFGWILGAWGAWISYKAIVTAKFDSTANVKIGTHANKWAMVLWAGSLVPLFFISAFLGISIHLAVAQEYDNFKISRADPNVLVADCRRMITDREKFKNEPTEDTAKHVRYVINLKTADGIKASEHIPLSILKLNPTYIEITDKEIIVALHTRSRLIGFAEGAKERGTRKLIDGLWYYGGSG